MNLTKLTDQELAERYHQRAVEFIKKHGREPTGIDSLRHHSDYMMTQGHAADIDDLQVLTRLFNLAMEELVEDAPDTIYVDSCSPLIANMLSTLRSVQQLREKPASK